MEYKECCSILLRQINQFIIGKEEQVEYTLTTLLAKGHLLLEDVPGVGKTTLAQVLAKSISCDFGRIQFTPDTLPSDVTGMSVYNMKEGTFDYQKGAIMHNIVLADEINRTSPKTQASLLEAMEEKQVTVDGASHTLEQPFMVIATQNPIDFLGTYHLPEAQLDRFFMRLSLGYPDVANEKIMLENMLLHKTVNKIEPVITKQQVIGMQDEAEQVMIHSDLLNYIIKIVDATRKNDNLALGASPRATKALVCASQAYAYLKGREFVIPDDIQHVYHAVLCHRLVVASDARISNTSASELLKGIVKKVPVPVMRTSEYMKKK